MASAMPDEALRIRHAAVRAAPDTLDALERLYAHTLGLPAERGPDTLRVGIGHSTLRFTAGDPGERPFQHLALLVPGNRFAAGAAWLRERDVALLPMPGTDETTFAFPHWRAQACYFEDPAGNIMELIAHAGLHERAPDGPFTAQELLGLSEVGLVVDDLPAAAAALEAGLGVRVWDGDVSGHLAFAGRRAHTLILVPRDRGWLPTGRPAEVHPIDVTLTGTRPGEVALPGLPYRIRGG